MTRPSVGGVLKEITGLTNFLVMKGFADDQNYPIRRGQEISFPNAQLGIMLRNVPYADLYETQRSARSYNILMLDGALIQMNYMFERSVVEKCRLAFLPSPSLLAFQNDPELYEGDLMFAEVVARQVVTVPIRFEFDDREGVAKSVDHPRSHVTLGQYPNCRIAASAPVTPGVFVGFILRSFYNTALRVISDGAPCAKHRWESSITVEESALLHVAVP